MLFQVYVSALAVVAMQWRAMHGQEPLAEVHVACGGVCSEETVVSLVRDPSECERSAVLGRAGNQSGTHALHRSMRSAAIADGFDWSADIDVSGTGLVGETAVLCLDLDGPGVSPPMGFAIGSTALAVPLVPIRAVTPAVVMHGQEDEVFTVACEACDGALAILTEGTCEDTVLDYALELESYGNGTSEQLPQLR